MSIHKARRAAPFSRSCSNRWLLLLLAVTPQPSSALLPNPLDGSRPSPAMGWQTDYIGPGRGHATLSLGVQFWKDYFHIRNLIARSTLEIAPGLRVVVKESPWYLDLEALISPHTAPNRDWFRDRQGPAQLAQEVTYRFYRNRR